MQENLRHRWSALGLPEKALSEGSSVASMRVALMAQGFEAGAVAALRHLPPLDLELLASEMSRTGLRAQFEAAPADVSAAPAGPQTLFGAAAELFREAWILDGDAPSSGPQDAAMAKFFEAVEVYLKVLSALGKAVGVVVNDVGKNLQGARAAFLKEPEARSTLRGFLQAELESDAHKVAPNGATKLKDPSGACQLQWLLRGCEFLVTLLQMQFEGHRGAPQKAYGATLQNYHSWQVAMGVKAMLVAVPGKDKIAAMETLCPELEGDKEGLAQLVGRDVQLAADAGLPLLRKMVELFREVQLWEDKQI